jgi:hypothetical protein
MYISSQINTFLQIKLSIQGILAQPLGDALPQ